MVGKKLLKSCINFDDAVEEDIVKEAEAAVVGTLSDELRMSFLL